MEKCIKCSTYYCEMYSFSDRTLGLNHLDLWKTKLNFHNDWQELLKNETSLPLFVLHFVTSKWENYKKTIARNNTLRHLYVHTNWEFFMYFVRIFSHIISCFINTIQVNTSRSLLQYKVVCFINFILSGNTQIN